MIRRARLLSVVAILLAGAIAIISSTQTWFVVVLEEPSAPELTVAGAAALPLLAPLSLAALALGLALSIVGRVMRYAFGALAVAIAFVMLTVTVPVAAFLPSSAAASTVTESTGLAGAAAVEALVASMRPTVWPWLAVVAWALLGLAGVLVVATAHRWRAGGRRFRAGATASPTEGPLDSIDSWDDLSRGDDPTAPGTPR